jgi:hypothetical protein
MNKTTRINDTTIAIDPWRTVEAPMVGLITCSESGVGLRAAGRLPALRTLTSDSTSCSVKLPSIIPTP